MRGGIFLTLDDKRTPKVQDGAKDLDGSTLANKAIMYRKSILQLSLFY
jgi:hypothetical protein